MVLKRECPGQRKAGRAAVCGVIGGEEKKDLPRYRDGRWLVFRGSEMRKDQGHTAAVEMRRYESRT